MAKAKKAAKSSQASPAKSTKPPAAKPFVLFITGLSGAGISTALNALADCEMHCIDNLPVEILDQTLSLIASGELRSEHGFGFGVARHDERFVDLLPKLKARYGDNLRFEIIFLTSDLGILATRYSTTRRKHPIIEDGETLVEAILRERELISPLEEIADAVIDTSTWSPHMLARAIEARFAKDLPPRTLHVTITSFGFKYGQHKQLDTLFDVRFLENPHFVPELREMTGLDADVAHYVFDNDEARQMFAKMDDMLRFLLPLYYKEGKHYFRIGIGCSGGRHRSVAFAERLGESLLKKPVENVVTTIVHRDIDN
jgi:UPF0042 nucleotide-binding protein